MSNPNDYTIGWICAIRTAYIAAQVFLDEEHDGPESVSLNDNNDYTLGKIGKHNVVIAVLPSGEYGISTAAVVARDMLSSFPNVRIGLMVGIGSGAPSQKHDIRLGDIVVSAPSNGGIGVFQYDFGDTIQHQRFKTTEFFNQLPMVLRVAVHGLQAQHEIEGHQLEEAINNALERNPRLRKTYSRQRPTSDRLYKPEVVHPAGLQGSCNIICGSDPSSLVCRQQRTGYEKYPKIHYGLIASANNLMEDAVLRDTLAAEKDVLCFETEAAGLMNRLPCLFIRGICDYADSHKNKEWQGYAAIAAAAYTKHLLKRILTNRVDGDVEGRYPTALSLAAANGHEAVVKLLLDNENVDVNPKDSHGRTSLSWAAANGHEAVVKLLLGNEKVDVNSKDSHGRTSLSWAAANGHEAVVKLLLGNEKVNVDLKDSHNQTPLSWATKNGHEVVMKLLLDPGQLDVGSESISDVSDMPSLFSESPSVESRSSAGLSEVATQYLARLLSNDPLLQPLYIQALQEFGIKRFTRNHDRLLKKFLADLLSESKDSIQQRAVRFLQHSSRREQVTLQICQYSQPHSSLANQQTMRQLRAQEGGREYRIKRYLADEADHCDKASQEKKSEYEECDNIGDKEANDERDDEDEEEEEDDSDDATGVAQIEESPHFESVVALLTRGPSFHAFKSSLYSFVNPPTSIEEALLCRNIKVVRQLLRERFEIATQGEYLWVRELDGLGYTRDEIAELLFEQVNDAPWIYFAPSTFDLAAASTGVHLPRCVHQSLSSDRGLSSQPDTLQLGRSPCGTWRSVIKTVEELCGLAGITPTTRDMERWGGSVTFEERNSVATVTCSRISGKIDPNHREIVSRLRSSLERFCLAAGHVQAAGLCCDSFTVLCLPSQCTGQQLSPQPSVEVCQIGFELPLQLLSELKDLSHIVDVSSMDIRKIQTTSSKILRPFHQETTNLRTDNSVSAGLQLCSLAIQAVCLSFLSYAQAHAGPIQPFFLDTPLERIRLLGNQVVAGESTWIEASLKDLTCIGKMIRSQVLVFSLIQLHMPSLPCSEKSQYNLKTNVYDLLDTWGPGRLFTRHSGEMPFAIEIGNGVVYASDLNNNEFHWSRDVSFECLPEIASPLSKMIIGTSVIIKEDCTIDAKCCWTNSSTFLEPLGPYRAHWSHDEKQYTLQGGYYVVVQAIAGSHKLPGHTLKQHRLQQDDGTLVSFLDDLWGLQVSFCTHVARRVPLREMVVDLLPVFAVSFPSHNEAHLWKELQKLNIIGAFQRNEVRDWLVKLPSQLYQHVLKMVRRIFVVLQHTGLDRERKNFLVAWPHEHDIFRCFKVACEKESSWAGVLEDSEDTATFAYITTRCFETEKIKCSGPSRAWQGTIPLLETAVLLHAKDPSTTILKHDATFFFQKLDHLFFVKVQRPDPTCIANLVTFRSRSPTNFQRRLLVKFMGDRRQQARLRERISLDDFAEDVAVFH